ncbi:hypothetical protein DER44DRAFT_887649, partial [Fusarium oxysporum]
MILGPLSSTSMLPDWTGGILRFDATLTQPTTPFCNWFLSSGRLSSIEIEKQIPSPNSNPNKSLFDESVPVLAGVEDIVTDLKSHLLHESSVLLIGVPGTGKSSMSPNEERIATIRDTLEQSFPQAALSARLGGRALVILEDVDKLCIVETELMIEMIASVIKRHSVLVDGVAVLATAQTKESLHNVIIGNHVFRETLPLGVSNKVCRRKIRETVIQQGTVTEDDDEERDVSSNCPETADGTQPENSSGSWMDVFGSIEAVPVANATPPHTFNPDIDFADLTNITESYMPRDLVLFVERA